MFLLLTLGRWIPAGIMSRVSPCQLRVRLRGIFKNFETSVDEPWLHVDPFNSYDKRPTNRDGWMNGEMICIFSPTLPPRVTRIKFSKLMTACFAKTKFQKLMMDWSPDRNRWIPCHGIANKAKSNHIQPYCMFGCP